VKRLALYAGGDRHWLRVLTTADKILILCLAFTTLAVLVWQIRGEGGARVWVRTAGHEQGYSLSVEQAFRVAGPLGESLIEIAGGRVRIAASPCRHQVCVRRGWISRRGDVSVCLPNELALIIEGAATDLDAVVR
jgi:hypothetical protein